MKRSWWPKTNSNISEKSTPKDNKVNLDDFSIEDIENYLYKRKMKKYESDFDGIFARLNPIYESMKNGYRDFENVQYSGPIRLYFGGTSISTCDSDYRKKMWVGISEDEELIKRMCESNPEMKASYDERKQTNERFWSEIEKIAKERNLLPKTILGDFIFSLNYRKDLNL